MEQDKVPRECIKMLQTEETIEGCYATGTTTYHSRSGMLSRHLPSGELQRFSSIFAIPTATLGTDLPQTSLDFSCFPFKHHISVIILTKPSALQELWKL